MNRKFGIELEIVGISKEKALNAIKAVGVKVQSENYNHDTKKHWKLVPDGSVNGGFEVVSPILQGEAGIDEAEIVARALEDAGAYANRTCGFHVHFDAHDIELEIIKTIVRRYAAHESEIDAFMPPSRRGNTNQYCRSLDGILTPAFENASTLQQLANAQGSRYYKVNLQSAMRHGTIEFRQHSGTVNAAKICNWIRFLAEFIDESERLATGGIPSQPMPSVKMPKALEKLAGFLQDNGTVTQRAIMDTFGWLPHTARSAVARLRKAGFQIKAIKGMGESAYKLENAQTAPRAESLWSGINERVVKFYQRRAAVLAIAA